MHSPEGEHANEDGEDTLKDEDPSPANETTIVVHLEDTISEDATECTSGGGRRVEDGDSPGELVTLVPERDVVTETGEETSFGDTEEDADSDETAEVVGDANEGANDAPCNRLEGV